jgi:uncharacterized protein
MSKLPDLSVIDISPAIDEGTNIVNSYNEISITINNTKFYHSVIVNERDIIKYESFDDINKLNLDDNSIIIFGSKNVTLRESFYNFISKKTTKYIYEIMDLAPACRTFNVLIQEGRKVYAIFNINQDKDNNLNTTLEVIKRNDSKKTPIKLKSSLKNRTFRNQDNISLLKNLNSMGIEFLLKRGNVLAT